MLSKGETGFEIAEVDQLVEGIAAAETPDPVDDILTEISEGLDIYQPGDLWRFGPRLLICGNALDPEVRASLMAGERTQMVFASPPYNVPIQRHVSGLGQVLHRKFAPASGEMNCAEFTAFLETSCNEELALHHTMNPVAMIAVAIKDALKRGGIVLDIFGGSRSPLIATHKSGRRAYLCELDPRYCDRIIRPSQALAQLYVRSC